MGEGKKRALPQNAARVQRGADKDPSPWLCWGKGTLPVAPELGVWWNSPQKNSRRPATEKGTVSAEISQRWGTQKGTWHLSAVRTHLEERCRTGRGLGVSLLRLWPGERLSPRWPLREPRSLLLQQHRADIRPHTTQHQPLAPSGLKTVQSDGGQAGLVTDRRPYLCWSRGEGWGEGRRRSAGE